MALANVIISATPGRVVVIAKTKREGLIEARAGGIEPIAIVTPRSRNAARGMTADSIGVSVSLSMDEMNSLLREVLPCLATSPLHVKGLGRA